MKNILLKFSAVLLALCFVAAPLPSGGSCFAAQAAGDDIEVPDGHRSEEEDVREIKVPSSSEKKSTQAYPHKTLKSRISKAQDKYPNSDIRGWLVVPGTNISMPIAYSSVNNTYLAYRTLEGVNLASTINYKNFVETATYLDFRTRFGSTWKKSSRNTVLYGHNWTNLRESNLDVGKNNNHIMFGQLPSYVDMDFAKANPHIYYSTPELEGVWRVFSVAYVELSEDFNYNAPNPNKETYEKLLTELKQRSIFDFDVDVKTSDNILTLSTCTRQYNAGANQRFIVVARLLRDGETENDKVKVTVNKNVKKPVFK